MQAGICSAIIASFAREEPLIHKLFLKAEEILLRNSRLEGKGSVRALESITLMPARIQQEMIEAPDAPIPSIQHKPLLSDEKLKQLYTEMLRVRQNGDGRSRKHQKDYWRLREAPIVGFTIDLRAEDSLIAATNFPSDPNSRRAVLSTDFIVPLATGVALLHRLQARGNLVIAFIDAKQTERNRKFLRIAQLQSLPIIYVQVEKAVSKAGPERSRIQLPMIPVDKADVVAIYRVASEAFDKARRGAGPTLIQCVPFSLKKGSFANHHSQDPIRYMEYYLRKKNLWSDELKM